MYARVRAVRLWAGDDRDVPFSCRWVGEKVGLPWQSVGRALGRLVACGVLVRAGDLPGRGRRGTALYAPGPLVGEPVVIEAGAAVRHAADPVEPERHLVDDPLVRDAVERVVDRPLAAARDRAREVVGLPVEEAAEAGREAVIGHEGGSGCAGNVSGDRTSSSGGNRPPSPGHICGGWAAADAFGRAQPTSGVNAYPGSLWFDPADYVIAGRSLRMRQRLVILVGLFTGTGPCTFVGRLWRVGSGGGSSSTTALSGLVAVGTNTANVTNPGPASITAVVGAEFDPTAFNAALYVLMVNLNSAMAGGSAIYAHQELQIRYI